MTQTKTFTLNSIGIVSSLGVIVIVTSVMSTPGSKVTTKSVCGSRVTFSPVSLIMKETVSKFMLSEKSTISILVRVEDSTSGILNSACKVNSVSITSAGLLVDDKESVDTSVDILVTKSFTESPDMISSHSSTEIKKKSPFTCRKIDVRVNTQIMTFTFVSKKTIFC